MSLAYRQVPANHLSCLRHRNRLNSKDYVANDEDFLRAYAQTTGVFETYLESHRLSYRIFDVGGAFAERRKWHYTAEDVQCLIFIASLTEYDTRLENDDHALFTTSHMDPNEPDDIRVSLTVFENLMNNDSWFKNSTIVLLLNRTDVFRKKIKEVPIRQHWPEFNGPEGDYDAAVRFFTGKFCSVQRQEDSRDLYVYYSEATDTENSRIILQSIEALLVSRNQCSL